MSKINIPTKQECFDLIREKNIPPRLIKHILAVTKISLFLAKRLIEKGEPVNIKLVQAGALLHDIDKIETLENGQHGYTAYDYLMKLGYPEIAQIPKKHVFNWHNNLSNWEEKIVIYADLRVTDSIVSLKEEFEYLLKKYGTTEQKRVLIKKYLSLTFELEKEIFDKVGLDPDKLKELVEKEKIEFIK